MSTSKSTIKFRNVKDKNYSYFLKRVISGTHIMSEGIRMVLIPPYLVGFQRIISSFHSWKNSKRCYRFLKYGLMLLSWFRCHDWRHFYKSSVTYLFHWFIHQHYAVYKRLAIFYSWLSIVCLLLYLNAHDHYFFRNCHLAR